MRDKRLLEIRMNRSEIQTNWHNQWPKKVLNLLVQLNCESFNISET